MGDTEGSSTETVVDLDTSRHLTIGICALPPFSFDVCIAWWANERRLLTPVVTGIHRRAWLVSGSGGAVIPTRSNNACCVFFFTFVADPVSTRHDGALVVNHLTAVWEINAENEHAQVCSAVLTTVC